MKEKPEEGVFRVSSNVTENGFIGLTSKKDGVIKTYTCHISEVELVGYDEISCEEGEWLSL